MNQVLPHSMSYNNAFHSTLRSRICDFLLPSSALFAEPDAFLDGLRLCRIAWIQWHSFCSRKPGAGCMGVPASLYLGLGRSDHRLWRHHSPSRRLHFSFAASSVAGRSEAFHGRGGEMAERGLVRTTAARSCGAGGLGAGTA